MPKLPRPLQLNAVLDGRGGAVAQQSGVAAE
jgi:hypothetical protein